MSQVSIASGDFSLGVIGVDSSHLPAFASRIADLHQAGNTRCRVTHLWTDGRHDMPQDDVDGWLAEARKLGVERVDDLEAMLDAVDGVMVLAVNGNRHLELALPALRKGLPTYVDKPLTCSLAEAKELLEVSRASNARCYSASSLRFVKELEDLRADQLGDLVAVDAFGPGELNDSMAGLFFYGVHAIELVDAILGPGVSRISAVSGDDRDLVGLEYHDGRFASIRLERKAGYAFGATVHGTKNATSFVVDFEPVYARLIVGLCDFFEGGKAPVALRDIVENVAVMEAGNRSQANEGAWVPVEEVR
ncbi:MAG: Gfo/Idh/MocA family oxidoreductase [Planctomycetota bacterium]